MSIKDSLSAFGIFGLIGFYLFLAFAYICLPLVATGAVLYVAIHFLRKIW